MRSLSPAASVRSRSGFGRLWTGLVALPLMMAIQEICDHTAQATGKTLGELARACTGVLNHRSCAAVDQAGADQQS